MPRKTVTPDPGPIEAEQDTVIDLGETVVNPEEIPAEAIMDPGESPVSPEPVASRTPSDDILATRSKDIGIVGEANENLKWGYLSGAARRGQVLTGVVSNLVRGNRKYHSCAVDFEGLRVLIPFREMTLTEWPEDEEPPDEVRVLMHRCLGATIDFIPVGVDVHNRAAVGSRKAAMLRRQEQYYQTEKVMPGVLVACRVLAVGNHMMTVEACGVDAEIYARDISWEWFSDITTIYASGDVVVARVMEVSRDEETGLYSAALSIKKVSERADREAFERLEPNTTHFGIVTGKKNGTYFIRLQSGANAKTRVYRSREIPGRNDTVGFRISNLDEYHLVAHGYITRIIKRHTKLG